MREVLHAPTPVGTAFSLVRRRWRRESTASAGPLRFKVLIGMTGIPAHLWDISAAERILGSSCAKLEAAASTVAMDDLRQFFVSAWCIHPDLVPQ